MNENEGKSKKWKKGIRRKIAIWKWSTEAMNDKWWEK